MPRRNAPARKQDKVGKRDSGIAANRVIVGRDGRNLLRIDGILQQAMHKHKANQETVQKRIPLQSSNDYLLSL
jgi:hypothetical protein